MKVKRRGLGKVHHMRVTMMWLQKKAARGDITLKRVPGLENTSDIMTSFQFSEEVVIEHKIKLGYEDKEGRHPLAPQV